MIFKKLLVIIFSLVFVFINVSPVLAAGLFYNKVISSGMFHTLYKEGEELYAWGDNSVGQLGDGTLISRLMPVIVPFNKGSILSVSAGMGFSLVLTSDGKLWKFGLTLDPSNLYQKAPVQTLDNVQDISSNTDFALALKNDGTVWAWGINGSGQLGNGNTEQQLFFTQVSDLSGITQISAGADHSLALDQDGNVWAWGNNAYGQLGTEDNINRSIPIKLTKIANIKKISAGYGYSLALDASGKAYAWGKNDVGQLGVGDNTFKDKNKPQLVDQRNSYSGINAGTVNSFAYDSFSNVIYAWGDNSTNLINNNADSKRHYDSPYKWDVPSYNTLDISVGYGNIFYRQTTGRTIEIKALGYNYSGQLGDGTMIHSYSFSEVLLDQNKVAVHRLGGKNRLETATRISQSGWPYGVATSVILARADSFPDALSGTPLAYATAAPILLTDKTYLSAEAASEIKRIEPTTIYLLGGESAISKDISNKLEDEGHNVVRLGGNNRYETSKRIAEFMDSNNMIDGEQAVICNGLNYPDALSASSAAAYQKMPILLTAPDKLSDAVQTAIQKLGVKKTYVIGGTSVISDAIKQELPGAVRYGGSNRYDTSLEVAKNMGMDTGTVFFASGNNFPDALAGSALASFTNSPVVLIGNNPPDQKKYQSIINQKTRNVYILGGESAISDDLLFKMENKYFPTIGIYYEI